MTYVPSRRSPELVSDFAHRLATKLNLACHGVVEKTRETDPQKTKQNSSQQHSNIEGAFTINGPLPDGPPGCQRDAGESISSLGGNAEGSAIRSRRSRIMAPTSVAISMGAPSTPES